MHSSALMAEGSRGAHTHADTMHYVRAVRSHTHTHTHLLTSGGDSDWGIVAYGNLDGLIWRKPPPTASLSKILVRCSRAFPLWPNRHSECGVCTHRCVCV